MSDAIVSVLLRVRPTVCAVRIALGVLCCAVAAAYCEASPTAADPGVVPPATSPEASAESSAEGAIDLRGPWRFSLDPKDEGLAAGWMRQGLPGRGEIRLPTTTDLAGIGAPEPDPNPGFLSRRHKYIGPAWYQREITIPEAWRDREAEVFLERVLWESRAWIDGRACDARDSLGTPHVHSLGRLTPGRHVLTLRIDNRMIHPIGDRGHCYTDFTQTIWNGAVGRLELRARSEASMGLIRVFPDAAQRRVDVEVTFANRTNAKTSREVGLTLRGPGSDRVVAEKTVSQELAPGVGTHRFRLELAAPPATWDEFTPRLYALEVRLGRGGDAERRTERFGFRVVERRGNRLLVNGRPTFLRGNLDCAQYPRTGHPPMSVAEWRKVFDVCRQYGLNHIRFHSWCPPEAAFVAADEMGFYLLVEVLWIDGWMGAPNPNKDMDTPGRPRGVGRNDRTIDAYVQAEMRRTLDVYGNHPSFCFFAIGNELSSSDFTVMGEWIRREKQYDPRRLYAASTARAITPADDFSDTHLVPGAGAVVNHLGTPHTDWNYEKSYRKAPVPILAHEMGQMPVYPDWREIAKYAGPVQAKNFELFRREAARRGIAEQSEELQAASGAMNRLIYKNEMEAQLRSPSCSGVSWLSMQDFPGQGEALVGWLDVFYESKGIVTPEQFRRYGAPTVPLARFAKFVWTSSETFTATAQAAHWGSQPIRAAKASWVLRDASGEAAARGEFPPTDLAVGSVTTLGAIRVDLARFPEAQKLRLEIALDGTTFVNDWNLWVFPSTPASPPPAGVLVTDRSDRAWDALARGERVILAAHRLGDPAGARRAAWLPLFWSARFFPNQNRETLGAHVEAKHPALAQFPTDHHLDWQWREICENAHGFLLDDEPAAYRPIVQPVSDYHFNHKLGTIFEFAAAGGGRLLVCGYDIVNGLEQRPAARQLRKSLSAYAAGDRFAPKTVISKSRFEKYFPPPPKNVPTAATPPGFEKALLYVRAGAKHPGRGNTPWTPAVDAVKAESGFGYAVRCNAVWKDDVGTAWWGEPSLRIELKVERPDLYDLYVHFHDWNGNGRTGEIVLEGRRFELGPHAGAGQWVKLRVLREDALDQSLVLEARGRSGPNLQITALALMPHEAE